ncbi:MAG: efflux RND transporter periplasmic adaptor subunit [Elusimicrobia bacterium]|nr:efflux RND transporter periplasmic adaptor subunit [Candidatus Obscuribacterium magneticum]
MNRNYCESRHSRMPLSGIHLFQRKAQNLDSRFRGNDAPFSMARGRVFVALFLIVLSACNSQKEIKLEAFPVHVQAAELRTLEEILIVSGSLKAQDEATLFSRVSGKLKDNLLKEGDPVKKGQAVSLVERDEVGVTFEPAPVPSTLNGIVGRTYLDRGMNVGLDTPVALVVDDSEVLAQADIPERYAGRVAVGQSVRVRLEAYSHRIFTGRVSKVSPVVSPATRTAPIEVTLKNDDRLLKSGMFAELSVVIGRKADALAVPLAAVLETGSPVIFVARDGKAERREVTLGIRDADYVEIKGGVTKGEAVITTGLFALQNGSPVEAVLDEK